MQLNLSNNQLCGLDRWGGGTFTAEGITALAESLKVTASLTECNVRDNQLDSESATLLSKVAREKCVMLFGIKHDQTEVDFRSQGLSPVDAILIASDLSVSPSLTELNIDGNEIGQDGALAIAQAISEAPSLALKKLVVPHGVEKDERLKAACEARGVKLV